MKRLIKFLLSCGFCCLAGARDIVLRLAGRCKDPTWVILNYHGISPEQRARFAKQMDDLLRHAKAIPIEWALPLAQGQRYASITFDDGLACIIENALPELRHRKIPATVFVVAGKFGQYRDWPVYNAGSPESERMLSVEEVREFSSDILVGSHTLTHPVLTQVSEEQAYRELEGSRRILESALDRKITLFSFPYGAFNDRLVQHCREAGYAKVFTTLPVLSVSDPEGFVIGRVPVDTGDWPLEFRLKLLGAYRWLPFAFAAKRKLLALFGKTAPRTFSDDS